MEGSPKISNLEETQEAVLVHGKDYYKVYLPEIGKVEMFDTEDAEPDLENIRTKIIGYTESGEEVALFRKEEFGKVVVDEVIIDGKTAYKRPTIH